MKSIIVGFSQNNKPLSKLIRYLTRSNVSHSYIRVQVAATDMVFQASGLSVNYEWFPYFKSYQTIVDEFEIEVTDEQYKTGMNYRLIRAGRPYSMKSLLGYLIILAGRVFGLKLNNIFADEGYSYVCSELVAEHLHLPDAETWTPEDLLQHMRLHYGSNSSLKREKT